MIVFVALIILTFCRVVQAQHDTVRTIIVNGDTIFCDSTLKTLSAERAQRDLKKIARLDTIWRSVHDRGPNTHPCGGERIYAGSSPTGTVTYRNLNRYGIRQVSIRHNDEYPFHIKFNAASPRNFSRDEHVEYNTTERFPAGYCSFSEEMALARSRAFIDAFYGPGTADRYDSLRVTHHRQNGYCITFRVKIRNDIRDYHSSTLEINPNNGELLFFNGATRPGLSESDYSYVPVISRQQALQMYQDECAKIKAVVKLHSMFLFKETDTRNKVPRWEWQIFGKRTDQKRMMATFIIINSETGAVVRKSIF